MRAPKDGGEPKWNSCLKNPQGFKFIIAEACGKDLCWQTLPVLGLACCTTSKQ